MQVRMSADDVIDAMQLWVDTNMTGTRKVTAVRKESGKLSDVVQHVYVEVDARDDDDA